jgi:hypothetical protein
VVAAITARASPISEQEKFGAKSPRDGIQAIVRHAFQATVAEQDDEHRGPKAFAEAWRLNLGELLEPVTIEISGWSTITVSEED